MTANEWGTLLGLLFLGLSLYGVYFGVRRWLRGRDEG